MTLISLSQIDQYSKEQYAKLWTKSALSLHESQEREYPDDHRFQVFLSHSYTDAALNRQRLLGLKAYLEGFRLDVYVDWLIDRHLDREEVTANTGRTLRNRMNHSRCLFFATSENSQDSRWMPWELGYMDGRNGKVAILPLVASTNRYAFVGQEYLGMYPYVDTHEQEGTGEILVWINEAPKVYVSWREWMKGTEPYYRG